MVFQQTTNRKAVRSATELTSAVRLPLVRFLLMGALFGLLTGLAEISLHGVKKFLLQRTVGLSADVIWMAPLANLILFCVVGLFLFLLARYWPRLISVRAAALIFAFLGFLSLLLMYKPLHIAAKLLLAAGFAVQASRLMASHKEKFYALAPRAAGLIVALITLSGLGVHGWQTLAERRALMNLPPAASNAPNVLLITLDTVRAQSLSVYGHSRPTTPHLEQLAKNGVLFEQALSTTSWTLPSHASMFTGRLPSELSVTWDAPLGAKYPTIAERLSTQGYATSGFVANHIYCTYEYGLNRGFVHWEDFSNSFGQLIQSSSIFGALANNYSLRHLVGYYELVGRKKAPELNEDFLRWLDRQHGRPFFAFLNYYDAHNPYLPDEPFDVKFTHPAERKNPWLTPAGWDRTPQEVQTELHAYEASIAYLDYHLGLLFEDLERRNVLNNTLVIITSDHGEEFDEHGVMGHGSSLYLPSLHVPLLISFPERVPAGQRVPEAVSLRDLPATIVDLLEIEDQASFPGTTLARYWDGKPKSPLALEPLLAELEFAPNLPLRYPVSKGNMKSLHFGRFYYIKNGDGREELYDLENDPSQTRDLVLSGEAQGDLERLRIALQQFPTSDQQQTNLSP